ncbi:MAG: hypothetical protein Q7T07_14885 [Burkholderiaceae bacterium]|nr:hypothetical protein [Burkholderiaceae bacterium]
MNKFSALMVLSLSLSACAQKAESDTAAAKPQLNTSIPWLQAKIWEFQSQPVANPPRTVSSTVYEGKTVYYISAACCDIPSQLFDEDGKLICYPSGGIAGGGDGRCKSFILDNPPRTPVWQDTRLAAPVQRVVPVLQ